MKVLVAPITNLDPYGYSLVGNDQIHGPALTAFEFYAVDRVILLSEPSHQTPAEKTSAAITKIRPGIPVELVGIRASPNRSDRPVDWLQGLNSVLGATLEKQDEWIILLSRSDVAVTVGLSAATYGRRNISLAMAEPPRSLVETPFCISFKLGGKPASSADWTVREPSNVYHTATVPEMDPPSKASRLHSVIADLGICGEHASMKEIIQTAAMVAEHAVPVLIQGETGVGKGLIARLIHQLSDRDSRRFVSVNCGALPTNLVESILFGHCKGAFTGATQNQCGKFEQANGGTLLLDEIGELPMQLQPKLLKVLEDGYVEPLGSEQGRNVDVRIVAATNRDLKQRIQEGMFREDLYYRLSFALLEVPPLRERQEDIPLISARLLENINESLREPKRLSKGALRRLMAHSWPGNVRDLENVIGRSALLTQGELLDVDDLLIDSVPPHSDLFDGLPDPSEGFSLERFLQGARECLIQRALERAGGHQKTAAKLLGLSPQAINKFVKLQEADV